MSKRKSTTIAFSFALVSVLLCLSATPARAGNAATCVKNFLARLFGRAPTPPRTAEERAAAEAAAHTAAVERGTAVSVANDAEFSKVVAKNLKAGEHLYVRASEDGSKYLRVFAELGWEQKPGTAVPRVTDLVAAADARTDAFIAASGGAYTEADVLRGGKVLRLNGKVIAIRYGEPIPAGAKVEEGLLTTDEFVDVLDQGVSIISGAKNGGIDGGGIHNLAQHDLVHLAAEVDGADGFAWSKAIREGARKLRGVHIKETQTGLAGRVGDILENLEVTYPSRVGLLHESLELPAREAGHLYTVPEVEAHLTQAAAGKPDFYKELLERIKTTYPRVINTLGGTAGDPYYRYVGRATGYSQFAQLLTQATESVARGGADAPRRLAQLEAALMDFATITPAEWTTQGLAKTVSKRSKLYKILCTTGMWDPGTYIHAAYCAGAGL